MTVLDCGSVGASLLYRHNQLRAVLMCHTQFSCGMLVTERLLAVQLQSCMQMPLQLPAALL